MPKGEPHPEISRQPEDEEIIKYFRSCEDCGGGAHPEWAEDYYQEEEKEKRRCGACGGTGQIEITEDEARELREKGYTVWEERVRVKKRSQED